MDERPKVAGWSKDIDFFKSGPTEPLDLPWDVL